MFPLKEGLNPPGNVDHHFETMLKVMTRLYNSDPLGLKLHMDFWSDDGVKSLKSVSSKKYTQQVMQISNAPRRLLLTM